MSQDAQAKKDEIISFIDELVLSGKLEMKSARILRNKLNTFHGLLLIDNRLDEGREDGFDYPT